MDPMARFPVSEDDLAMQRNERFFRRFAIVLSLAALISFGWHGEAQVDGNVIWSSRLHLKSLDDIPNKLRESVPITFPQEKLTLTNGKISLNINTCEEYLNAVNAGFSPGNNFYVKMSGPFVKECYVLRDLQQAHSATSNGFQGWNKDSLTQLPPLLVGGAREATDAAEAAEKRGENWQQYDPNLHITKIDGDTLFAEDDDDYYYLDILARADFNGDGAGDIAMLGCEQGKHSSWSRCNYYIFSQGPNGKLVRLTHDYAPYRLKVQFSH
jgi:hypothetical protein